MAADPDRPLGEASWRVHLELASQPETLTLVRAVLGALAERLAIDPELLDDMKTAISEACNNVVQHAYPNGSSGPLQMELSVSDGSVLAVVRDRGVGLSEHASSSDAESGVGLPVIRTLADDVRFSRPSAGGTELTMAFATRRNGQQLIGAALPPLPGSPAPVELESSRHGDVAGSVSPVDLLGPVLGRLARALAAAANFSLDRFSDVYLVTDAIGALMVRAADREAVVFTMRGGAQRLELAVAPLRAGSVERLRRAAADEDRPSPLIALSDVVEGERRADGTELMRVVLVDQSA